MISGHLIPTLFFFFFKFYFIFKLYIIVLVLPNIKMNPPQVYMCSNKRKGNNLFLEEIWCWGTWKQYKPDYHCWCSATQLCQTLCNPMDAACQASLSFTISWSLLKHVSIESLMPSIQPSHFLLTPSHFALNLSQYQSLFQWISSLHHIGASATASVLPMNIQGWFRLGLPTLIL